MDEVSSIGVDSTLHDRDHLWIDGQESTTRIPKFGPEYSDHKLFRAMVREQSGRQRTVVRSKNELHRTFIIHPEMRWKSLWDALLGLLTIISAVDSSLSLCFSDTDSAGMMGFIYACQILFVVDLFASFRTAFAAKDKALVISPRLIAERYLKTWFAIDILSCFPGTAFPPHSPVDTTIKLARLIRLCNVERFYSVVNWLRHNLPIPPVLFEVGAIISYFFIMAHFGCCLWYYVPTLFSREPWFTQFLDPSATVVDKYVASLYYVMTTLATIGYGDIVPVNAAERILSCVFMILGTVSFGSIMGRMAAITSRLSSRESFNYEITDKVSGEGGVEEIRESWV